MAFFDHVKSLGPSAIDIELRMMGNAYFNMYMEALEQGIQSKRDFELYQAYLSKFLKIHGYDLNQQHSEQLKRLVQTHNIWEGLLHDVGYCQALVEFSRS